MADNSKIADHTQDLIKTLRDGEKGYREAAEHAKSLDLKARFERISAERGRFADELEREFAALAADLKKGGGHVVGPCIGHGSTSKKRSAGAIMPSWRSSSRATTTPKESMTTR